MNRVLSLVLAVLLFGCSHSHNVVPDMEPGDFSLTIEAVGSQTPGDERVLIAHHLVNRSHSTVCVGGSQAFTVNDAVLQANILHDALCGRPLLSVLPGRSATWTLSWSGSGCWPKGPAALLEAKPRLKCGTEVEVRSKIWLFRLHNGVPQFGGTPITSQPLTMRVAPGIWEAENGI